MLGERRFLLRKRGRQDSNTANNLLLVTSSALKELERVPKPQTPNLGRGLCVICCVRTRKPLWRPSTAAIWRCAKDAQKAAFAPNLDRWTIIGTTAVIQPSFLPSFQFTAFLSVSGFETLSRIPPQHPLRALFGVARPQTIAGFQVRRFTHLGGSPSPSAQCSQVLSPSPSPRTPIRRPQAATPPRSILRKRGRQGSNTNDVSFVTASGLTELERVPKPQTSNLGRGLCAICQEKEATMAAVDCGAGNRTHSTYLRRAAPRDPTFAVPQIWRSGSACSLRGQDAGVAHPSNDYERKLHNLVIYARLDILDSTTVNNLSNCTSTDRPSSLEYAYQPRFCNAPPTERACTRTTHYLVRAFFAHRQMAAKQNGFLVLTNNTETRAPEVGCLRLDWRPLELSQRSGSDE
ncbi:hypothetical protein B0H12DRAFT_1077817 [Mycena haematopus]|nr:hypothetical protein B0H12DRAFT_1077817 [Mycena haematopus]